MSAKAVGSPPVCGPITITADNMHEYMLGITTANDVSACDVRQHDERKNLVYKAAEMSTRQRAN